MLDPDDHLTTQLREMRPDIVFNALHGTYGEDGVIQGILEWMDIPYTGSKLTASALAMDKALSRHIFSQVGLPVARAFTWDTGAQLPDTLDVSDAPWIVKPTNEGSSVGLDLCHSYDELIGVLSAKDLNGPKRWLIEEYVQGIEVSVVVFEHEVWGSVEVVPSSKLYDYEAKYERGDTQYFCPPRLELDVIGRLEGYAARAYRSLGCKGICRADFITSASRDILLEVNTLPGMTETSLVPKVAAARGIEFEELVRSLIMVELERGPSL
jgi:D-alanine-D-alanine ligase